MEFPSYCTKPHTYRWQVRGRKPMQPKKSQRKTFSFMPTRPVAMDAPMRGLTRKNTHTHTHTHTHTQTHTHTHTHGKPETPPMRHATQAARADRLDVKTKTCRQRQRGGGDKDRCRYPPFDACCCSCMMRGSVIYHAGRSMTNRAREFAQKHVYNRYFSERRL